MYFPVDLVKGEIVKCYKNLILDVRTVSGELVSAFCPELDAKQNMYAPGAEVWLLPNETGRHLKYETLMVNKGEGMVMISPVYTERLMEEAFADGLLADFAAYDSLRRIEASDSVSYANLIFTNSHEEKCFVYAVTIYNKQGGNVVFPTFINFFEMEMFREFAKLRQEGHETRVVLIVPRSDCAGIKFTWNISPVAAAKIFDEAKNGLKFCGYGCTINAQSVKIIQELEMLS